MFVAPDLDAALALTAIAARPAAAETYPSGPIRIIVGFGPSSTADIVARLVGKFIEERLGQPGGRGNRPANSSMTAAEAVGRAPNDGRTLFMATVANGSIGAHGRRLRSPEEHAADSRCWGRAQRACHQSLGQREDRS